MRRFLCGLVWAAATLGAGCQGSSGPTTFKVTGTVTFDSEPIQQGYIMRTPRGRVVTRHAYLHFGINLPKRMVDNMIARQLGLRKAT